MNASRQPACSGSEAERQARIDLAACHRLAAHFGLHEGIDNHMTMLVPGYSDPLLSGAVWTSVVGSSGE